MNGIPISWDLLTLFGAYAIGAIAYYLLDTIWAFPCRCQLTCIELFGIVKKLSQDPVSYLECFGPDVLIEAIGHYLLL